MKKVSVVIPFKDELIKEQLQKAILSLKNQTIKPYEIILVGIWTDRFFLDKEKLNKSLKLINFEGDKNQARNRGITISEGDYILYLDHDMQADKNLIADCIRLADNYDALIIVEKGVSGSIMQNIKKLERELIIYDIHTVTPRFYRKNLFNKGENPFDDKFGLLDEWGFNTNLSKKKAKIGYSNSSVIVEEPDLTLWKEVKNKFKRGMWMKNFYKLDSNEAWVRTNPINRGIIFYGSRLSYLFKEPIYFPLLMILKLIDFIVFMLGYVFSFMLRGEL